MLTFSTEPNPRIEVTRVLINNGTKGYRYRSGDVQKVLVYTAVCHVRMMVNECRRGRFVPKGRLGSGRPVGPLDARGLKRFGWQRCQPAFMVRTQ